MQGGHDPPPLLKFIFGLILVLVLSCGQNGQDSYNKLVKHSFSKHTKEILVQSVRSGEPLYLNFNGQKSNLLLNQSTFIYRQTIPAYKTAALPVARTSPLPSPSHQGYGWSVMDHISWHQSTNSQKLDYKKKSKYPQLRVLSAHIFPKPCFDHMKNNGNFKFTQKI